MAGVLAIECTVLAILAKVVLARTGNGACGAFRGARSLGHSLSRVVVCAGRLLVLHFGQDDRVAHE
jgi:hypothetical protein